MTTVTIYRQCHIPPFKPWVCFVRKHTDSKIIGYCMEGHDAQSLLEKVVKRLGKTLQMKRVSTTKFVGVVE